MTRFYLGKTATGQELWRNSDFPYVDLRGKLPGNPQPSQGTVYKDLGVVIHYNGPKVTHSDLDQLYIDARYHIAKDWGGGYRTNGIQYEWAVGHDGTKYRLRNSGASLWHCGNPAYNVRSVAATFLIGEGQHATKAAKESMAELCEAQIDIQGLSRSAIKGHLDVNPSACPGTAQAEFVAPFRRGEDWNSEPEDKTTPRPKTDKIAWVNYAFKKTDDWARKVAGAMAEALFAVGVRGGLTERYVKACNDARNETGVYTFVVGGETIKAAAANKNLDESVRFGPQGKVRGVEKTDEAGLGKVARWRVAAFCDDFGLDKGKALQAFEVELEAGPSEPETPKSPMAKVIDDYFKNKNYFSHIPYEPIGETIVEEVDRQGEKGLYYSTACALIEKETGGKNLFGCDWGDRWTNTPPYCRVAVTKDRVQKLIANVKNGGGQNGVGYTQLTTISYVYEAEKLGGAHLAGPNMRVGFRVLLDHILSLGWPAGAAAYNAGAGNWRSVINTYGADMARLEREWAARLSSEKDDNQGGGELMKNVETGLKKALEFRGIKYGYWTWQRNFVLWANGIPSLARAREIGGVCSSVPNVYRLINGLGTPSGGKLKGGTGAWFAVYAKHRLTDLNMSYPAGTLFMSDYRGEATHLQGHVAVSGETKSNPWLIQSDTGLGWNDQRRLKDTQSFAGFTHYCLPEEWLS